MTIVPLLVAFMGMALDVLSVRRGGQRRGLRSIISPAAVRDTARISTNPDFLFAARYRHMQ